MGYGKDIVLGRGMSLDFLPKTGSPQVNYCLLKPNCHPLLILPLIRDWRMIQGAFAHPGMMTEEMFQRVKSTLPPPCIKSMLGEGFPNVLTMVRVQNLFYSAVLVRLPSRNFHQT